MIEGGTPNTLLRRGLTRESLPVGTEIVVDGYRAKNGSNRANGRDVQFPDGKKLFMGSSGIGAPTDGKDASAKVAPPQYANGAPLAYIFTERIARTGPEGLRLEVRGDKERPANPGNPRADGARPARALSGALGAGRAQRSRSSRARAVPRGPDALDVRSCATSRLLIAGAGSNVVAQDRAHWRRAWWDPGQHRRPARSCRRPSARSHALPVRYIINTSNGPRSCGRQPGADSVGALDPSRRGRWRAPASTTPW
jgi:hypothetical protein